MKTTDMEKPDFNELARKYGEIMAGYATGCERIWENYVVPLQAHYEREVAKLGNTFNGRVQEVKAERDAAIKERDEYQRRTHSDTVRQLQARVEQLEKLLIEARDTFPDRFPGMKAKINTALSPKEQP